MTTSKYITWKPLPVHGCKYLVSSNGYVYSLTTNVIFRLRWADDQYMYIRGTLLGKKDMYPVHVLVAMTFLPRPAGCTFVRHLDGDPLNNSVDNLEWVEDDPGLYRMYRPTEAHAIMRSLNQSQPPLSRTSQRNEIKNYSAQEMSEVLSFGTDADVVWLPLPYTGNTYMVSNTGYVWGVSEGRMIDPYINRRGYASVKLFYRGDWHELPLHHVVALAHLPSSRGLRYVRHADGNYLNNHVSNLLWIKSKYTGPPMTEKAIKAAKARIRDNTPAFG